MKAPRTLLADDHTILVDGVRRILRGHVDVVGVYKDGQALLDATRKLHPDLVVTDISMPLVSGLEYLRSLKTTGEHPRVIVLSMYTDTHLVEAALNAGAMGYLPKHAAGEELLTAVDEVMHGRRYVSPRIAPPAAKPSRKTVAFRPSKRQTEVLRLVAEGKRMKEIASELGLSHRTVEMHKYRIMRGLGLRTTAELIQYYLKRDPADDMLFSSSPDSA
jgi:DNA-binding NarL/FixJ family response regulator